MDQVEIIVNPTERTTYRTEVPGPVKDVILLYLCPVDEDEIEDSSSGSEYSEYGSDMDM